jgi:hypothetical protein
MGIRLLVIKKIVGIPPLIVSKKNFLRNFRDIVLVEYKHFVAYSIFIHDDYVWLLYIEKFTLYDTLNDTLIILYYPKLLENKRRSRTDIKHRVFLGPASTPPESQKITKSLVGGHTL